LLAETDGIDIKAMFIVDSTSPLNFGYFGIGWDTISYGQTYVVLTVLSCPLITLNYSS
jgi:hypothetical protein